MKGPKQFMMLARPVDNRISTLRLKRFGEKEFRGENKIFEERLALEEKKKTHEKTRVRIEKYYKLFYTGCINPRYRNMNLQEEAHLDESIKNLATKITISEIRQEQKQDLEFYG